MRSITVFYRILSSEDVRDEQPEQALLTLVNAVDRAR